MELKNNKGNRRSSPIEPVIWLYDGWKEWYGRLGKKGREHASPPKFKVI